MLSPGKGELLTPKPKLPEAPKEPWKRSVKFKPTLLGLAYSTVFYFCCLAREDFFERFLTKFFGRSCRSFQMIPDVFRQI